MAAADSNDENDVLQSTIISCIENNNLPLFIENLTALKTHERCEAVDKLGPTDEKSPFFTACWKGLTPFVKYMLEECGANIELRGLYELTAEKYSDKVTPLWVSASERHLEVVKLLIENGAEINASSSTNSTPVRCACFNGDFDTVKYLIVNGADIHQTNIYGGTCLINANKGELPLCELLIQHGASVNETDSVGNNPLHFAVREGRLDLVTFFLQKGVNAHQRNERGDSALQNCAIYGQRYILDYLVNNTIYKIEEVINAYELLGSYYVDETEEFEKALNIWRSAMRMRWKDKSFPVKKEISNLLITYTQIKEPETIEDIDCVRKDNLDVLRMYSLMTRERILGASHRETLYRFRYHGAGYADNNQFQRGVDLWLHGTSNLKQNYPATDEDVCRDIVCFIELLTEMQKKNRSNQITDEVRIEDVLKITSLVSDIIADYVKFLRFRPLTKTFYINLEKIMKSFLHCLKLVLDNNALNTIQYDELHAFVTKVLSSGAKTEALENILLLALKTKTSPQTAPDVLKFPSVPVVKYLLQCGSSVDVVDINRNGPLHCCLDLLQVDDESVGRELATLLLTFGAHIDARNVLGVQPMNVLKTHGFRICPVKERTLKCLSAIAIKDNKIEYKSEVPIDLFSFVENH